MGTRVTGEHMAKILEFQCRETHGEGVSPPGYDGVSADVIAFPGVRYERGEELVDEDAELSVKKRHASKRKRDRLELAE